ncbi:MAG: right-handed parallel beta-helix repeat-containing protein, partial [bacterium]
MIVIFTFFAVIIKENNHNNIIIRAGINRFPQGLKVAEKEYLTIDPGAILLMGEGTEIEIKGNIVARGTKKNPIIFKSENNVLWRGIKIIGGNSNLDLEGYKQAIRNKTFNESDYLESIKNGNIFNYCHFENLAAENKERVAENRLKAAIEANNTTLTVSNSIFANIVNIGCVKTQDSLALVNHNFTDSKMVMKAFHFVRSFHITYDNKLIPKKGERLLWPVGIYTKSGVGIIYGNEIEGFGDNGIDNDNNCLVYIIKNTITDIYDDGIDIDYQTEAYVVGNKINSTADNGILISEQSTAILIDNEISNTNVGITLRNGGRTFIKNTNISQSKYGIKIFNQVPLFIDKNDFSNIKEKLKSLDKSDWDYYGIYT